jgi:hypothetical protein
VGQQQGTAAHARRSKAGFGAGMATTDHDHVILLLVFHRQSPCFAQWALYFRGRDYTCPGPVVQNLFASPAPRRLAKHTGLCKVLALRMARVGAISCELIKV